MIDPGKKKGEMFMSYRQIWVLILAAAVLAGSLGLQAQAMEPGPGEIVLREDGLLKSSISSLVAGLGATACVALVFVIVWKQWEP